MTDQFIDSLLSQLTLKEKISLLAGADLWHTVPVERLGIPGIKVSDGPIGVRGAQGSSGPPSTCFPVPVGMAATWNTQLIQRIGVALGEESRVKGVHILLAPMVNIHRTPLNGRYFECFSEDPYLTSRMAAAYVSGVQSQGVGTCIKHFICNDSEYQRRSMSSEVGERALREIYLYPFQMVIKDANPWAIMSGYNKLNGAYCSENDHLLNEILKDEWSYDGLVISDWYGTYSERAAGGGLDLEMPGPAIWMGVNLIDDIQDGVLSEELIDDKVRRLLRTIRKAGAFENPVILEETASDPSVHRSLARQAAAEAVVLLKNEGVLPLDSRQIDSLAIIGENARWAQVLGGGSSAVTPHYIVSPLAGIRNKVGESLNISYEIGCIVHRSLPRLELDFLNEIGGEREGFRLMLFDNSKLDGEPAETSFIDRTQITWADEMLGSVNPDAFSARLEADFVPAEDGMHTFSLSGNGLSRLSVDGEAIVDTWTGRDFFDLNPWSIEEVRGETTLAAGRIYRLVVEYGWQGSSPWRQVRIGYWSPCPEDLLDRAAAAAARSDVAIVFAGLTDEWEKEGEDRTDLELRGEQAELIQRVAAVNPNTIVVLNTGAPVTMDWLSEVPAVLQAWYGGQEAGNAIADVLFGDTNPSGKLPTTFPKRLQDNPSYINYPGENGKVFYGEGIFVGYRYYDKKDIEPLFPFGFGLSYTSFNYSSITLNTDEYKQGDEITVAVDVQNTGQRTGKEVVQLYIRDLISSLIRPDKELKRFAKVNLEPGEKKTVKFTLNADDLAFYDDADMCWRVEPGEFEILIGSSSRDIRQKERIRLVA